MTIYPELSKNTWKVLIRLAKRDQTPIEVSLSLAMPLSRISEAIKELSRANILKPRKGYEAIELDRPLKNSLNMLLADYSEDKIADLFFGARLDILFEILEGYERISSLKVIANCSGPTLKRILNQLQRNLLIYQSKKGVYSIRVEFKDKLQTLSSCFISYFLDSLKSDGIEFTEYKKFGEIFILKSSQQAIPGFFKTGFSVFNLYNVPLLEINDNYFVNLPKPPTQDEVFIHALLFSLTHQRDTILCMLFAEINNLDPRKMRKLLMTYKIEAETIAVFKFLRTKGKIKEMEFLPDYLDYLEVRRDYVE